MNQSSCYSPLCLAQEHPPLSACHVCVWTAGNTCVCFLKLWHTTLKRVCLPHTLHVLPNVGHCICLVLHQICLVVHHSTYCCLFLTFCSIFWAAACQLPWFSYPLYVIKVFMFFLSSNAFFLHPLFLNSLHPR